MTTTHRSGDEIIESAISYAKSARRDKARCGKFIRELADQFIQNVSAGRGDFKGYQLEPIAVERVVYVIESLPHIKGAFAGQTIHLLPWQDFHFVNIFGWSRAGGIRKHKIAFTQIAKKNGKSTMAAPVGIYMLSPLEGEAGAEVYCAASKRDQARIVLDVAQTMVNASPEFRERCNMTVFAHHIEAGVLGGISRMRALSADVPKSDDGINSSCVLADELHSMTDDGELRDTLLKGMVARSNSLLYQISTAGKLETPDNPCLAENNKAWAWLKGERSLPHFYGMIYEQDDAALEIEKPKTWIKSNPSIGHSLTTESVQMVLTDASNSPTKRNDFIQKHLNQFTGVTEAWLSMPDWDKAQAKRSDMPPGLACYGGFDLSSVRDLTAVGWVWIDDTREDEKHWWIAAESFATALAAEKNEFIAKFVSTRDIKIIGEKNIDYSWVHDHIVSEAEGRDMVQIGYDRYNATMLAEALEAKFEMVEVIQGARTYSEPMKNFEVMLLSGRIHILGNPGLTWQAGNLQVHQDRNDNWTPIKKSSANKIDAVVAILIAFVLAWSASKEKPLTFADVFPDMSEVEAEVE